MRARIPIVMALVVAMLAGPMAPARAADEGETADSRVGVLAAAACGMSLRAALIAPVPWAGVAAATCLLAFLDAAMSP